NQPNKAVDEAKSTDEIGRPANIREAHLMRGNRFEESLLERIPNLINCDNLPDTLALAQLFAAPEGATLYQPKLSVPQSFYTKALVDAGITFSMFIPDFVEIRGGPSGRRRLFIIDAKSSSGRKMSHQVSLCNILRRMIWREVWIESYI